MTFRDGGNVLNPGGTPVLVDPASGIASITITLTSTATGGVLAVPAFGMHNITATYNNTDPNFAGSASPSSGLNVGLGPTNSNVASIIANPSVIGQAVTFQDQVLAPGSFAAPPTGTVSFYDGGVLLGQSTLAPVGGIATATFTVPTGSGNPLTLGQHVISTIYSGDGNYAQSSTALSPGCSPTVSAPCALVQTVNQATTTTYISSSSNGSTTGQQITSGEATVKYHPDYV
jgi:hypothetical protein